MSSWFGRSGSSSTSSIPAASSVHKQRNKQIEYLREHVPNVVEVRRDELYRVDLVISGINITLEIKLPLSFPLTDHSPVVSVYPPLRHPWINEQMLVDGSPLIKNFTIHSNLGRAVQQIIKEFTEHPPELSSQPLTPGNIVPMPEPLYATTSLGGVYTPYTYTSPPQTVGVVSGRAAPATPTTGPTHQYQLPTLPDKLEDIGEKSTEELERYLTEEEGPVLVDLYVSSMDTIKRVHSDRDKLFAENEDQAGLNLRYEPAMQENWTQLQEKFLEMQSLKSDHEQLLEEQRQLTERYTVTTITTNLKSLCNDAETESEIIADEFLDKKLPLQEFILKFKQQRVLHHERKSKHEKLTYKGSSRR